MRAGCQVSRSWPEYQLAQGSEEGGRQRMGKTEQWPEQGFSLDRKLCYHRKGTEVNKCMTHYFGVYADTSWDVCAVTNMILQLEVLRRNLQTDLCSLQEEPR